MNFLEVFMLIAFGFSSPLSIAKGLKTKSNGGKSFAGLVVVFLGYLAMILNKFLFDLDFVVFFYILNALMILTDILVYLHNENFDRHRKQSLYELTKHTRI